MARHGETKTEEPKVLRALVRNTGLSIEEVSGRDKDLGICESKIGKLSGPPRNDTESAPGAKEYTYVLLRQLRPQLVQHLIHPVRSISLLDLGKLWVTLQMHSQPHKHARSWRNKTDNRLFGLEPALLIHNRSGTTHTWRRSLVRGHPFDVLRKRERLVEFEVEHGFE